MGTPQSGWDPSDQGAPTGMRSCKVTPCLHELCAPVSPSFCSQELRTGRVGPPQPLSEAGDGLEMPLAAFRGFGGQSWVLQREMKKPTVGIFKENTLEQQLLDSAHSGLTVPPSLPANVRAAREASPATSGASGEGTCALGRRAQGILHSSAQIVTTLLSPLVWCFRW